MTPPPKLTDEQIDDIDQGMCGERECAQPFARAIESTRDQQWVEMLSKQEPVAYVGGERRGWTYLQGNGKLPFGTSLYAAPQPPQQPAAQVFANMSDDLGVVRSVLDAHLPLGTKLYAEPPRTEIS